MPDSENVACSLHVSQVSAEAAEALPSTAANQSPNGSVITVDALSLRLNGKPWLPVMGELHYARIPREQWRDELLKTKLGGIDIVSTYVFWIYHEEIEGEFDWSGGRDLRTFAAFCLELGLTLMVRLGPWCHGEVRNGGLPDWLLAKGVKLRSEDPEYLTWVRRLYAQIRDQCSGLLWKDGGPIIGIQVDNEYDGPAEYLLTLKKIAVDCGFDVPLYTRTGWPELTTPMPLGEILPLYGGYADGFWDRSLAEMPPGFAGNFLFRTDRNDSSVATDQLGVREIGEETENCFYPYFACEIGGGMAASYHRRIVIDPRDIESLALSKIGSGNNLQGYYMYCGGTNPKGRLSSMQESQATGYWNDMPELTYDFNAPIGEFGQLRPHYHLLRRIHLFLRDFGADMALMPLTLPDRLPTDSGDSVTLRWAVRSDEGGSGYLFVNNYQRLQSMPAKPSAQFDIELPSGKLCVPEAPLQIPADICFFWPLNMDIQGARLTYATAQPVCRLDTPGTEAVYVVFGEIPGIPAEFVFATEATEIEAPDGMLSPAADGRLRVHALAPGLSPAITLRTPSGETVHILLLSDAQSLACWKASVLGQERLILSDALPLTAADGTLRLQVDPAQDCRIALLPAPSALYDEAGKPLERERCGHFNAFVIRSAGQRHQYAPTADLKDEPSPPLLRTIRMGSQNVAESPTESDFDNAVVWLLNIPKADAPNLTRRLSIRYTGDVARLYLNGKFLLDNFYNGEPFELGLDRYGDEITTGELLLKLLPLQKNAPIYLPRSAWPDFGGSSAIAQVHSVKIIELSEQTISATAGLAPNLTS